MDDLSDLKESLPAPAPPPSPSSSSFFHIDTEPLPKPLLLSLYSSVLAHTHYLFAPFGLPHTYTQTQIPSPFLLMEHFRPAFDLLLDVCSEEAYKKAGVSEAAVAVAVHYYLEEEGDEEVREALGRMQVCL